VHVLIFAHLYDFQRKQTELSAKGLYTGFGGVAEVVQCLFGKCKALCSKPHTAKKEFFVGHGESCL
jgi:hypothetical protein